MAAMIDQMKTLHHTSRAFYVDALAEFAEKLCKMFSYDKMLPMNTGIINKSIILNTPKYKQFLVAQVISDIFSF